MAYLFVVGRVILGLYFLKGAFNHFQNLDAMTGYAASKGVPAPKLGVAASGALLAIAGLSMLTGYAPEIGVLAIVLFLLPVSFFMHAFWKDKDPEARQSNQIHFLKNMAILASALMFLAIEKPWPMSVGRP